jgi:hypothetical protein
MTIDATSAAAPPATSAAAPPAAETSDAGDVSGSQSQASPGRWHVREQTDALLAGYRHVARCEACHDYAARYLMLVSPVDVLIATLAHHDSSHRYDLIDGPGRRFSDSV